MGTSKEKKTTGRKTRAGNDLDAFPFDKLSVDGAALAKMIISPLPNPNFRTRDPLDSTTTTANSSDEDIARSKSRRGGKKKEKSSLERLFEDVEISPKAKDSISELDATQTTQTTASPSSGDNKDFFEALKSPDPEAKHISRIRRSGSGSVESARAGGSNADTYYEVYDSPRADEEYTYESKSPEKEYYSDVVSESGWESGMSYTVEEETVTVQSPGKFLTPRMTRVAADILTEHSRMEDSAASGPVDPDGEDFNQDNISTTGEDIAPTPNLDFTAIGSEKIGQSSKKLSVSSSSASRLDYSSLMRSEDDSFDDLESPPSSISSEKPIPQTSPFPSYRLLVCMVVTIALVAIGLVAGLTFYLWEKSSIDPICPPDDFCCSNPSSCSDPEKILDGNDPSQNPLTPTDEELLKIFQSVVGEAVTSDFTSAGMAANWMLYEDPGKFLKPRSDQAWIQRYLLVYTYYATTLNRSTEWLSCNPATEDEMKLDDSDACMFTYPTELPGGNIIYDMVPSHRWLSAVDECQWGGVACSATVVDEINIDAGADGSIPIKSTMKRLAVTSIVLADQNLKGSVVTELTALPMLQVLDLSHNGLQGTINEKFGSLQTLRLQYNAIQGRIPKNFFTEQSVMKELNVGSNFMTGTIPDQVGRASFMTDLYLFGNRFTGPIPSLGNMPLVNFHGQQNSFTGVMPFDYGGGSWPDTLREWWVYDNKLTGSLSETLGSIANLEDIRVNKNELTGRIPESIKDLKRLFRFDVQDNSMTGTVPESIGDLPQLRDVHLQFNNFEDVVPTTLCFLESMEVLEADCLSFVGEPRTDCYCCTTCCNPDLGGCQSY